MSKTLAEVGYSIRNQVKGFFSSDDERISIDLVYDIAWDIRSLLIKEEYQKHNRLSDQDYSSECCLEIQCRQLTCGDQNSGELEYYVEIPQIEGGPGYSAVKYFGSIDKKHPFRRTNFQGYQYGGSESYTGGVPRYTIVENEAILTNLPTEGMQYVCLIAILESPKDFCEPNQRFPISRHLIHKLEMLAIKQLMSTIQIGPDETNNATDDTPQQIVQDPNKLIQIPNNG